MITTAYHRLTLSEHDRSTYDALLDGGLNHDERFKVPMPECELQEVFDCVYQDNPQLFAFRFYTYHQNRNDFVLQPEYLHTKEEYLRIREQCVEESKRLISGIKGSDRDKALAVHDMFCREMRYVDIGVESHSILGPLLKHEGVCEGFSQLYKLLMDMLDVECITVLGGYDKFGTHMWNCVKIDGKWRHVDVTGDMNISDGNIERKYFLMTTDEIMEDHKAGRCLFDCNDDKKDEGLMGKIKRLLELKR